MSGERLPIPPMERLPGPDAQGFAGLPGYLALMQRCWAQEPELRPTFRQIVEELRCVASSAVVPVALQRTTVPNGGGDVGAAAWI